jgi:TRAP-type mannitol/chloroaromatic compound transport system substrate-binding protein
MLQSFHQNAEQFEITFNKTKYDALPEKMKAIIANAVEAASADMSWKAIDRYSKDYIELQTKDKVKFYKTPDPILQAQLEICDAIVAKKSEGQPLFQESSQSQKAFAERAVQWELGHLCEPAHGLQPLLRRQEHRPSPPRRPDAA